MEDYTSDSSDSDNIATKILDLSYQTCNSDVLYYKLDNFTTLEKKSVDNVDTLLLHHNQLNTIPVNINYFRNLKVLDISSNGLTELPEVLSQCPLTSLIAKNNRLKNDSFPKSFGSLTNLKELNLSGNNMISFPDQVIEIINLKYLYLGGNQISNISKDIWKLTSLQILYLGGNRISEVPTSVGQLKFLQALILSDNNIEILPAAIANLKNLKSLLLHKNRIRTLPPEIIALKCLTELSLRDNPLVVSFVSNMSLNPPSLLEHAGRAIKVHNIAYKEDDLPLSLREYLESAHHCVNPKCKGVFFDNRVEHIKFVDFCGKYRIPLLQYLCSSKCIVGERTYQDHSGAHGSVNDNMMRKVLLG